MAKTARIGTEYCLALIHFLWAIKNSPFLFFILLKPRSSTFSANAQMKLIFASAFDVFILLFFNLICKVISLKKKLVQDRMVSVISVTNLIYLCLPRALLTTQMVPLDRRQSLFPSLPVLLDVEVSFPWFRSRPVFLLFGRAGSGSRPGPGSAVSAAVTWPRAAVASSAARLRRWCWGTSVQEVDHFHITIPA